MRFKRAAANPLIYVMQRISDSQKVRWMSSRAIMLISSRLSDYGIASHIWS